MGEINLSLLIKEEREAEEMIKKAESKAQSIIRKAKEDARKIIEELSKIDESQLWKEETEKIMSLMEELETKYENKIRALNEQIRKNYNELINEIVDYVLGLRV